MVHLLPHWTHPGKEGVTIPVVVYTNCEGAELFLNGRSLGEKPMTEDLQIVWQVPYEPGTIQVAAKNMGKIQAEKSLQTADYPAAVRLTPDRMSVRANRRDVIHLEVDIVDESGVIVPYADNLITFHVSGPAGIIGVENGDIRDFSSMKSNSRKAFMGKCLVILQSTEIRGKIVIKAETNGLKPANLTLHSGM